MKQDDLTRNLEEASVFHAELLDAAKMKRKGLVGLDLEIIRTATAKEEKLVERVRENEDERRELIAGIAEENGLEPEKVKRLREIFDKLGSGVKSRVDSLRAELIKMAGALRRINNTNKLLAEQVLTHLHGFLGLIAGAADQEAGYGPGGKAASKPSTTMPLVVDRKV
ncbi:MAG: flagellar protein FlgN [Planctomycetota bacterium]|nr:MAG: flagellar protein FlgN [Planctomycetota bacterium]